MTETLSKHERNLAAIIHGSTFSRFFIPFGNFLVPLVLWMANRKQYEFVDYHGKQALNFQISLLLYSVILGMISIPFFLGFLPNIFDGGFLEWNDFDHAWPFSFHFDGNFFDFPGLWVPAGIGGILSLGIFVVNITYTILATIRTNEGEYFRYPITIKFIK
ncbi:DUF4870 domain-containing protein [Robiginitalea sp. IMCC44478]|jgi:uncharacterized Tic20 family protein|uniref:DUF4870 domain-containing protein n=1 Tax=Robiginitalea sp. IMCC44478 TaxID=3459122 RepID=UPI0040419579